MTRSLAVRPARSDDVPALAKLWQALRALSRETARERALHVTPPAVEQRLAELLEDPRCRVIVAEQGGAVLGMAVLSLTSVGQLLDRSAVQLSHVIVADGHRHHGVGRALVGAAVAWGDEIGAEDVVANVSPSLREANRFYARLGFAPLVVRRVASVPTLRRRLAQLDRRPGSESRLRRRMLAGRDGALALRPRLAHAEETGPAAVVEHL